MDTDNGLFAINLSSDSEPECAKPDPSTSRARRTQQTEEAFQAVKASYRPRVENGNIHEKISLPLPESPPKMLIQDVVHAVEELYFLQRYADALDFVERVRNGGMERMDKDSRELMGVYEERCRRKMEAN